MNKIKSAVSAILAAVMLFALAACHPANETAMTVGDVTIPSGIYLCALIQADGEGRNTVDAAKSAEATSSDTSSDTADGTSSAASASTSSEAVDYYKEKIEDTDFTAWVKNRAQEICVEYAAYTQLFNQNELKLSEEDQKQIDTMSDTYWNSYGYSQIYEPNGVSFDTYKEFFTYTYRTKAYFMSLYGEGGEKAIPQADIDTAIADNFTAAKVMSIAYYTTDSDGNRTDKTDEEITSIKTRIQDYATRLEAGENFNDIYLAEYPDSASESTAPSEDDYVTVFVSEAAQPYMSSQYFSYEYFEQVKALEIGKTFTDDNTDNNYSVLMQKVKNISEYTDYTETFTEAAMYILKQEEFENEIKAYSDGLKVEVNNYAVNRFKPSDIEYPSYAA